jgi:hypothetical protein
MPIVNPKKYPIRGPGGTDKPEQIGQVHNSPRYSKRGGFTGQSKIDAEGFALETPTKRRSGVTGKKAPE